MSSILNVAECAFSNRRAPEGNEIIRYIKDHIRDNLTLTKLCEQFHMSRTTLAKIIYDLTGTSPMSYVLEERLTQVLPELVSQIYLLMYWQKNMVFQVIIILFDALEKGMENHRYNIA